MNQILVVLPYKCVYYSIIFVIYNGVSYWIWDWFFSQKFWIFVVLQVILVFFLTALEIPDWRIGDKKLKLCIETSTEMGIYPWFLLTLISQDSSVYKLKLLSSTCLCSLYTTSIRLSWCYTWEKFNRMSKVISSIK